jgi:methyl-accepting chemotaxis protein
MNIKNWNIGTKLLGAFALLLLTQIFVSAITYNGMSVAEENSDWVAHTYEVTIGLNDILAGLTDAETGQRGFVITGDESYLEPYTRALPIVSNRLAYVRSLTSDNPNQQARLDDLEPLIAEELIQLDQTIALRRDSGFERVQEVVLTNTGKETMDQIRTLIAEAIQEEETLMTERNASAEISKQRVLQIIVIGALLAVFLTGIMAFLLSRSIAQPLRLISLRAQEIAAGDLTIELLDDARQDEIGLLNRSFRMMVGSLRKSTSDIADAVTLLSSSVTEILASTTQVAAGTSQAAAAITQTTTTVEEVRQAAQLSYQKAEYVADNAQQVAQASQAGRRAVEDAAQGMEQIRVQMEIIAQTVVRLSEQSQSIGGIIASVTDLADQSNLLAVNAAIEAAKAGEQGRGFAVVAQEIKSLSEQSKMATTQVREILSDVQKATGNAVMATEQGSKAVDVGVDQAKQAGEAIRVLADGSDQAVQAATQIMASSKQQVVGMEQIGLAMNDINQAGTQNAISMQQMEVSAQSLHELGRNFREMIEVYRLR